MNYWLKSVLGLTFLFFMLWVGYLQTQAPSARTDSDVDYAALTEHVEIITERPHPIGSAANREVRDYIVQYFESLGLETEVQKTTVVFRHPFRSESPVIIGNVENIFARLPGTGEGLGVNQDLVLMAHYDSRADGPGAGDDASGTASIMEAARIMTAGPTPRHDVVFLITDGEEMGLLGAQGFFRQHPLAQKAGLILDFEARGSYGVSSMFETSDGNAWLIDQLLESAPNLNANSLTYEIYKRMPNDTDMSITRGEGIPGLNFAFISGLHDYHSMGDSAVNLNSDTLAQQANYVLATARHFANLGEWPDPEAQVAAGDMTYFNLWNGVVVSYSEGVAAAFGIAVLLLGLWLLFGALRAGTVSWRSLGLGVLALFVLLALVSNIFESMIDYLRAADAGIAHLVSLGEWPFFVFMTVTLGVVVWFVGAIGRRMSNVEVFVPVLGIAAMVLLSGRPWFGAVLFVLIFAPLLLWLRSRKTKPALWAATLLLWWLLTAVVLFTAPNASYVFVWPLAVVLLGTVLQRKSESVLQNVMIGVVPLLLLVPVLILAYLALGIGLPQVVMMFSALVLLLLWPLLRDIGRPVNGMPALILLGAGLALLAITVFDRGFDARHQRGEEIYFAIDVDQQQAFWASSDARPGSWLGEFMGSDAHEDNTSRILPGYDLDIVVRETELPPYNAATLKVVSDVLVDGQREISLHLQSLVNAEYINLLFSRDVVISTATVNGFNVLLPEAQQQTKSPAEKADAMKGPDKKLPEEWWRWRWYGLPAGGAEITLTIEPGKALPVRIVEIDWGTPDGAPQRPVNSMPKSYHLSDSTVIFQTVVVD